MIFYFFLFYSLSGDSLLSEQCILGAGRRNMRAKQFFILVGIVFFIASAGLAATGHTYAIINCRVLSPPLPVIEKGVVIIRDGIIEAVGPKEKVQIPEDAQVVEAEGMTVYPGFINAHTTLFLETTPEAQQPQPQPGRPSPQPRQEERRPIQGAISVLGQLRPRQTVVDSFHRIGVTTILAAPERGIFAGQSVLLNLNGEKLEEMVVRNPVGLHIQFVTERGSYPNSLMGTMAFIRQSFIDAAYYAEQLTLWKKKPRFLKRPLYNPMQEALAPFVSEKKPVIFTCNNQEDIKRAIRLIQEFKLQAILSGATEAWRVIDELKQAKVPLLVSVNFRPPATSFYAAQGEAVRRKAEEEIYPANPAELYKAGLSFGLTSLGLSEAGSFSKNIQQAIKTGLPTEEALKALTIIPARILGVDAFLGTIEAGKIANVVLCSGDIFDPKSQIDKVWVDGKLFKVEKQPEAKTPPALSVAGSWRVEISGPMGKMEMMMELEQEGSRVRGTISGSYGRGEILDGTLSGQELSFTISVTISGQTMDVAFSGRVEKDIIEGTVQIPGGTADFRATRIPREL